LKSGLQPVAQTNDPLIYDNNELLVVIISLSISKLNLHDTKKK